MANIQCKMCGGELPLPENAVSGTCQYCGSLVTFPRICSDQQEQLYNRAEHFRRVCDYDKAVTAYEKIIGINPDDPEAYWGLVLSRFGIEYVEDPVSHERIPTCHRVQFESILADADYLAALDRAGSAERAIYEAEAKRIAEIQKNILAISGQEEPFDVFICYKESDAGGNRTKDSVIAQDIYYALQQEGLKVFFARITLEGKLGQQYEPYIFAALNSAKVMLVIGSKTEYFNAVWVRNEWSRYLALMKKDRKKLLIPCFKDMDAYDIPEELSMFQSQDMGKIGFIQDIIRGIKKVACKAEAPVTVVAAGAAPAATGKNNPLFKRAQLFQESGDFESARTYCENVLDSEPENGWAYFIRMMVELKVTDEKQLVDIDFSESQTFQLAARFADAELKTKIDGIFEEARRKAEEKASRKAINAALHSEAKERYNLLASYLDFEWKLDKRDHIIQALQKSMADEKKLFCLDLLTEEIVQPCREYSEQTMADAGDLATKKAAWDAKKQRIRQKISVAILVILFVGTVLHVTLYVTIPFVKLKAGYVCKISGNTVVGVNAKRSEITKVVIPDSVTAIESNAFSHCSNLTSVTIPDGVTTIGDWAFHGCSGLTSVTIPDSVTTIGSNAFHGCSNLTSVTIPDGVTTIGKEAFYGCSGLTSVTIPNGVTSIGKGAFHGCSGLTSVTLPDSVTTIGDWAFRGCSGLTSVMLPDSVTTIGDDAFSGCSNLTSVTLPDSVTTIGSEAFEGCSNLTSVTIPDSVTTIGNDAFSGCENLTSVTIPDSVTTIGSGAFAKCSNLTSVTIPDGVTTIGKEAFYGCSGLTSVTIPDSVYSIRENAFYGCSGLTSVTIPLNAKVDWSAFPAGCKVIRL